MDFVQDVGSILTLEHLNLNVPDQMIALHFYLEALGLTRDPYERVTTTAWINVGQQQFHLNLSDHAQVVRGPIGLVIPKDAGIRGRLDSMSSSGVLSDTLFSWEEFVVDGDDDGDDSIAFKITGPWGNEFHVFSAASSAFRHANRGDKNAFLSPQHRYVPGMRGGIGIAYIMETCGVGASRHIQRFYRDSMSSPARKMECDGAARVQVKVGPCTLLYFTEMEEASASSWGGHHVCIYVSNFSEIHKRFASTDGLMKENRFPDTYETIAEALLWSQFRVADVKDEEGNVVFQLEHEVRSIAHPYYLRPLANRHGTVGILQTSTPRHMLLNGWF